MFVDYDYYAFVFKGTVLTEDEFNKFGNQACMYITANTLSRITDSSVLIYPIEIQKKVKDCACTLAEYLKQVDDAKKSITGGGSASEGIVRSRAAGAVSVTYDTSLSVQYFLDQERQEDAKQAILRLYLSPVCIGTRFYNLLSKVLDGDSGGCPNCSVF